MKTLILFLLLFLIAIVVVAIILLFIFIKRTFKNDPYYNNLSGTNWERRNEDCNEYE